MECWNIGFRVSGVGNITEVRNQSSPSSVFWSSVVPTSVIPDSSPIRHGFLCDKQHPYGLKSIPGSMDQQFLLKTKGNTK